MSKPFSYISRYKGHCGWACMSVMCTCIAPAHTITQRALCDRALLTLICQTTLAFVITPFACYQPMINSHFIFALMSNDYHKCKTLNWETTTTKVIRWYEESKIVQLKSYHFDNMWNILPFQFTHKHTNLTVPRAPIDKRTSHSTISFASMTLYNGLWGSKNMWIKINITTTDPISYLNSA